MNSLLKDKQTIHKILIVKTSAIGDVTHTLPALHCLRQNFPAAKIDWLVEEAASDLIKAHPDLDRVLVSRRKSWWRRLKMGPYRFRVIKEIWQFVQKLRACKYDLLVDFQGLLKSSIFIVLARSHRKIGFGRGMAHAEFSYLFLTERVPAVSMDLHAVDREFGLLRDAGISCAGVTFQYPCSDLDPDWWLAQGLDLSIPFVAINPITTWPTKAWGGDKFADLADWLLGQGLVVVFTGSAEDVPLIQQITDQMAEDGAVNLAGKTTLPVLASLYKKAKLVIATDTGPMHIASMVACPVVALFGPTAPWRTGPYNYLDLVVRLDLPCSPCFQRQCDAPKCLTALPVALVTQRIAKVLRL